MQLVQFEIEDPVYERAKVRAANAGVDNLGDFLAGVIADELSSNAEDFDSRFTTEVIVGLDRVSVAVRQGAKTYSPGELDEHFRRKSQSWQENRT